MLTYIQEARKVDDNVRVSVGFFKLINVNFFQGRSGEVDGLQDFFGHAGALRREDGSGRVHQVGVLLA